MPARTPVMLICCRTTPEIQAARIWQREQKEIQRVAAAKQEAELLATAPQRLAEQKAYAERVRIERAEEQARLDADFESFKTQVRQGLQARASFEFKVYSLYGKSRGREVSRYEAWLRYNGMRSNLDDSAPWFSKSTGCFSRHTVSAVWLTDEEYPKVLGRRLGEFDQWQISMAW